MALAKKMPEEAPRKNQPKMKNPDQKNGGFVKRVLRGIANAPRAIARTAWTGLDEADVYRRWFASLIWGFLLFIVSWVVGYFLLKPQFLLNSLLSMKLFGYNGSVAVVALKNVAQQLLTVLVFIVFLNHFRVGKLHLSHYFFFLYAVMVGLLVGTNSYQFHFHFLNKWQALLPFGLYGVWEMIAYALVLAATTGLTWFETPGLFNGDWKRVRRFTEIRLKGEEIEVLIYGVLILAVSAYGEARQLVGRLGGRS